ncbi:MAG: hypothetical protein ACAI25_01880 [Planctomycetota bacterium]
MLRRSITAALLVPVVMTTVATSAFAQAQPRQGYVIVRKDGRKIEGRITVKDGNVIIQFGKDGSGSTDFKQDEVTITYTDDGAGGEVKRFVEIEKKDGGKIRGEVVEEKGDSITIKPRGQGPLTFKLSEIKVTPIEDTSSGADADVGDRYVDYEGRFQVERPNGDWKLRKSTSPETRTLMVLKDKDAFVAVSVKPSETATAPFYQDPNRENARKCQGEVEKDLKADLERYSGIQLDVGELYGAPVVEARYDGRYPSETTDYQFIEQRFSRDGLTYSIKAAAEKKIFKDVEPKLREAFACFSFIAPQGGDDSGYNDLIKGYGLERPTEKWTVDARPFDEKEPVVVRAEDGKAEIKVLVSDAAGQDAGQVAAAYLKGSDKLKEFSVVEQKDARRGGTPVVTYHCTYFEGRNVSKYDEQGVIAVVENRVIHVAGIAPYAGPESKDLQKEVLKALETFKVFDPKRKKLGDGAKAVVEYTNGVDAYKKRQYAEALSFLNKAIELYPDYARAFFWRATVQVELKGWKDYRTDLDRAVDLDPRPEMQLRASTLYLLEVQARLRENPKQWTDACRAWKEAIRNDPKNDKYRKDFLRFYQDWWQDLKRQNPGVKAKEAVDEIDDHKWSDKEFDPILATMYAEAGSQVLAADRKQYSKARSLASKALSLDKSCRAAQDLVKQCDDTKKALDQANKPKGK